MGHRGPQRNREPQSGYAFIYYFINTCIYFFSLWFFPKLRFKVILWLSVAHYLRTQFARFSILSAVFCL